jgi:UDP-N-acetylmuramoyl-L-alanyl-D-glutamate--2,6-diaminopimelate ligase
MIEQPTRPPGPMSLGELVSRAGLGATVSAPELPITDLACDPRQVTPGALFFCEPELGEVHERAARARDAGAVALVLDTELELDVPQVRVPKVRAAMGPLARCLFRDPTSELAVAGVTGTNGKTTTTTWLRTVLEAAGRSCGLLGTVKQVIGGQTQPARSTPRDPVELQRTFRAMVTAGDSSCAMEVTSHALKLHRVDQLSFSVKVFTNLSHDHLDFHGTIERYFEAKRRLFTEFTGPAVVNVDNEYGRRLMRDRDYITFSRRDRHATFVAVDERQTPGGTHFHCHTPAGEIQLTAPMPCGFNVENALAVIAAAYALGVEPACAAAALAEADQPPGRLETIEIGQPFAVYVDYAHTPDALERVLRELRERTSGQVIAVFGCGGDRDRDKRPAMGLVSSRLADLVVLTADNSRSEDPRAIIEQIVAGVPRVARGRIETETDRRAAIRTAIARAAPGDTVIVAGKGHERGQQASGRVTAFDDRAVVRDELTRAVADGQEYWSGASAPASPPSVSPPGSSPAPPP